MIGNCRGERRVTLGARMARHGYVGTVKHAVLAVLFARASHHVTILLVKETETNIIAPRDTFDPFRLVSYSQKYSSWIDRKSKAVRDIIIIATTLVVLRDATDELHIGAQSAAESGALLVFRMIRNHPFGKTILDDYVVTAVNFKSSRFGSGFRHFVESVVNISSGATADFGVGRPQKYGKSVRIIAP